MLPSYLVEARLETEDVGLASMILFCSGEYVCGAGCRKGLRPYFSQEPVPLGTYRDDGSLPVLRSHYGSTRASGRVLAFLAVSGGSLPASSSRQTTTSWMRAAPLSSRVWPRVPANHHEPGIRSWRGHIPGSVERFSTWSRVHGL